MTSSEFFLIAMAVIFTVPYFIWRVGRTDFFAPLVVIQIMTGIVLGPGILGAAFPHYYRFVFSGANMQALNGIGWWAVMVFVCMAGIELDLRRAWEYRRESALTASLALGVPLILGCVVASCMILHDGWLKPGAQRWQFILGIGMSCAVTALPILVLLMEKLEILRQPLGQRILRYASLDDVAIWGVLALILMDWHRMGWQIGFLFAFAIATIVFRRLMIRLKEQDRWHVALIWLLLCAFGADWSGLHLMVGAFLAGAVMDRDWFALRNVDALRHNVLLLLMPVFFLSTGLKAEWTLGGATVLIAAVALLIAAVSGKIIAMRVAGRLLGWRPGEANIIGWLLQTKALIMIIFVNILLDKQIITAETFTALLLMAILSTMLTVPMVKHSLSRLAEVVSRHQ